MLICLGMNLKFTTALLIVLLTGYAKADRVAEFEEFKKREDASWARVRIRYGHFMNDVHPFKKLINDEVMKAEKLNDPAVMTPEWPEAMADRVWEKYAQPWETRRPLPEADQEAVTTPPTETTSSSKAPQPSSEMTEAEAWAARKKEEAQQAERDRQAAQAATGVSTMDARKILAEQSPDPVAVQPVAGNSLTGDPRKEELARAEMEARAEAMRKAAARAGRSEAELMEIAEQQARGARQAWRTMD